MRVCVAELFELAIAMQAECAVWRVGCKNVGLVQEGRIGKRGQKRVSGFAVNNNNMEAYPYIGKPMIIPARYLLRTWEAVDVIDNEMQWTSANVRTSGRPKIVARKPEDMPPSEVPLGLCPIIPCPELRS